MLAEADQLRREADNIGPRAELDHWKKRASRFNYLLEQLKGKNVKAVIGVLHRAKSKLLQVLFKKTLFLKHYITHLFIIIYVYKK